MKYVVMVESMFFFCETMSLVHLSGWKAISQSDSHLTAASRSN